MQITIRRLDHNRDLPLPRYETAGAAGMDLLAAVTSDVVLQPGARGDLVVLDAPSHLHLAYRPGVPLVRTVVRAGSRVHDRA